MAEGALIAHIAKVDVLDVHIVMVLDAPDAVAEKKGSVEVGLAR